MKKIILAVIIVMSIGVYAKAQRSDGFFNNKDLYNGLRALPTPDADPTTLPILPAFDGNNTPAQAPLGTGIFLLTALGAGYAISKRRKEER